MDDWRERAAGMTQHLTAAGSLRSPVWREAFAGTPRQVFVPRFIGNDPQKGWVAIDHTDPGYAGQVYAVDALLTQLDGNPHSWETLRREGVYMGGWPSSSSSSPALMALMLEALDVHDGQQVLEVGTGTGYNSAILCHRLGDANVTSIDVDSTLVDLARQRLAELGYRPRMAALDAMTVVPHGSYDRIEVTVAVPHIPQVWVEHLRPGGIILANLSSGLLSDAMFKLAAGQDGSAAGRAIDDSVYFMTTRDAHLPQAYELHAKLDPNGGQRAEAAMPFTSTEDDTGFVSLLALGFRDLQRFLTDGAATWNWLIAADGSWVHDLGDGAIEQGGPRRLWPAIEQLWQWWEDHNRPGRSRIGLTVTADRQHHFWLDEPGNPLPWNHAAAPPGSVSLRRISS